MSEEKTFDSVFVTDDKWLMPVVKFRNEGYLQEVNRLFFHPLGMCLVATGLDHNEETGEVTEGANPRVYIRDYREEFNPYGWNPEYLESSKERFKANADRIASGMSPVQEIPE